MTEEIIIDGVDVAGCKYFNKVVNEEPYCNIDEEHLYTCNSDENCYYKQLKRLEQENKELEILAKSLYKKIEELEKENEALAFRERLYKADYEASEQENKELKEKKDKYYQQTLDDEILMNEISLEVDLRKKESDFYLEKLSKYRSALEEIREVLKFYADTWVDEKIYPNLHYDNTKAKEGLSRINEVLNDN